MKKLLIALVAAVSFAACNDDDQPAAWQQLPTTPITGENATLTVNGAPSESGSVQLTAKSATKGDLLLTNVLPGYAEIAMEVSLTERADGTGAFDIAGETGLTTPPVMITKAEAAPVIFNVSVRGYITPEGKTAVALTSALSTTAQGGLTDSWNLLKKVTANDEGALMTAPLWVAWSAKDAEKANAEQLATTLRTLGSPLLFQFLHSVTFSADGNVTAQYRKLGEEFDMQTEIMNCMFSGFEYDENYNVVGMADLHSDIPWLESPKGLLYWYVKGGYIYLVPDIAAIIAQAKEDSGSDVTGGQSDITGLLGSLGEYGINIDKLLPLVMQWMETGIPLKYEKTAGGLKLYADKEMCAPVIEALLPALPKLDEKIAELANSDDPMMQMLPMLLPSMLGVENLAALKTIWESNTDQFEISLNFEK